MSAVDHILLALAIRWLHVAAMAAILGGAVLMSWLAARGPRRAVVDVALGYEQVFWAAIGIIVMTGVGNLGAFGLALPGPGTTWGGTFTAKIVAVGALVALSLPRSLVVARLSAGTSAASVAMLRWLYGTTAAAVAAIAALAVWLAHG